jgi:hypothetical protein
MDIIKEVILMIQNKLDKEYFNSEIRFLETILNKLITFKKDFEDDCK